MMWQMFIVPVLFLIIFIVLIVSFLMMVAGDIIGVIVKFLQPKEEEIENESDSIVS